MTTAIQWIESSALAHPATQFSLALIGQNERNLLLELNFKNSRIESAVLIDQRTSARRSLQVTERSHSRLEVVLEDQYALTRLVLKPSHDRQHYCVAINHSENTYPLQMQ